MDTMPLNLSSQGMGTYFPENVISADETNFSPEALSKKGAQLSEEEIRIRPGTHVGVESSVAGRTQRVLVSCAAGVRTILDGIRERS